MKEAIGGISIFQIVIVFILLFTSIMCLTINHSKAFSVKDDIINIIENDNITYDVSDYTFEKTSEKIAESLKEFGYRSTGRCSDDFTGFDRNGKVSNTATFCVRKVDATKDFYNDVKSKCSSPSCYVSNEFPEMVYYEVEVFYQLDIPVIKNIGNFRLRGTTKLLTGGN